VRHALLGSPLSQCVVLQCSTRSARLLTRSLSITPCCSPPGTDTRGLVGQSRCQVKRPQAKRLLKF